MGQTLIGFVTLTVILWGVIIELLSYRYRERGITQSFSMSRQNKGAVLYSSQIYRDIIGIDFQFSIKTNMSYYPDFTMISTKYDHDFHVPLVSSTICIRSASQIDSLNPFKIPNCSNFNLIWHPCSTVNKRYDRVPICV